MKKTEFEQMEGHKYYGVADCHGIESFLPYSKDSSQISALTLRAMFNRQRHAVFFMAVLDDKTKEKVTQTLKNRQYAAALKWLKQAPVFLYQMPGVNKSWDMIPNPKLDPWRNE